MSLCDRIIFSKLVTSTGKLSPINSVLLCNLYLPGGVVVGGGECLVSLLCKSQGLLYGNYAGIAKAEILLL